MRPRERSRTAWSLALGIVAAAACRGDNGTGPVPCDTYTGGVVSGTLPGTYNLVSFCQGEKPNLVPPAATGTLTLSEADFSATFIVQGQPQNFAGPYATSGSNITVDLQVAQFTGTFTFRQDTLYVSGTLPTGLLSVVFHKTS